MKKYLQARAVHLWRVGVWWSALLASSRTPHVLQKVGCDSSNCSSSIVLQKILFQFIRAVRGESPDHFATSGRSSQTPPILHRGVTIFLGKKIQIDTFQSGSRGGPIIMTQIENEFGNYGYGDHPRDKVSIFCLSFVFLLL